MHLPPPPQKTMAGNLWGSISLIQFLHLAVKPCDDVGIRSQANPRLFLALVREKVEHIAHTLKPRRLLIIGRDDDPRAERRMSLTEHFFLVSCIGIPKFLRLFIDWTQLPLLQGILTARLKPLELFLL